MTKQRSIKNVFHVIYTKSNYRMISWDQQKYSTEIVLENKMVAPWAYILKFKRSFEFSAGQVVGLGVNTVLEPRLYSIASGETDEYVEILYTEKPEGQLTPMLSLLQNGDKVLVTQPIGTFTDYSDSSIFIATGTGIAPFVSFIKSVRRNNITLIHGVRTSDYFYFSELLKKQLGDNYIQCCTGFQSSEYFNGRVTKYIKESPVNPNKKYYLCGVAEMVVDVRDILISKGVPFSNIISEIYF